MILHDHAQVIAPPLTLIFQQIYDTGNSPQDWRDVIVSPIYKKGCKHDPQNYRPVSLTSIACKIHEHIVCSMMMSHLDTCGILTNDQHGFRKGLSTETQLLAAVHDWSHTLHKGARPMSCSLTSQRYLTLSLIVHFSRSWGTTASLARQTRSSRAYCVTADREWL